jgi:predicted ester cyclase
MQDIADQIHPNFSRHHARNREQNIHGVDGFRVWVARTRAAIPYIPVTPQALFAENDRVMLYALCHGTHTGSIKGVTGAGARLQFTVTALMRLADSKIVECWVVADTLGILQRVGAVAPLGGGDA